MSDTYKEKTQLLQLCRDINAGLFSSDDASEDIKTLLLLYNKCGNEKYTQENEKQIKRSNKADKKQLLKTVYISFINLSALDLSDKERLVAAEEIVKDGGFARLCKKYGSIIDGVELVRIASSLLKDECASDDDEIKRKSLLDTCKSLSFFKILFK
ncbi:MAG: hypothetical protein IKT65_00910 [Clostridia bacterium]|jgi:hypothetical protein|nr:hypothetical protein [Clostridia bacterium]